jgi:glyoxylate/hydroxypyruvate reductase A
MPVLLFMSKWDVAAEWHAALHRLVPDLEFRTWPKGAGDPAEVEFILAWAPPPGELAKYRNARAIISLGMGVDHLLKDPELPRDVPIVRMYDPDLINQMGEYVIHAVLHHHRQIGDYIRFQRQHRWKRLPLADRKDCRIGIMGLGAIGADIARKLVLLDFPVAGWSRSQKHIEGVESYAGDAALGDFLARSDVLVCLLPLTEATRGILDAQRLAQLPQGALFVNVGRGAHVDETALLAALDAGRLGGGVLDVMAEEPLPSEHPFWRHPHIRLTPHIAGQTNARTGAPHVAETIRRVRADEPLQYVIDPDRGY